MHETHELTPYWTALPGGKMHALHHPGPAPGPGPVVVLMPRGELRVVAGAAHTLNYVAPAKFVQAIRPFLNL